MWVVVNATALLPGRAGTHHTGGWVDPRAGIDGAENFASPGSDPRTVQPVAIRYTDCAILAHLVPQ
jgi:hypothetical protein